MLKNKVAIVTGGSRGIGRAICKEFAENGANVVINYSGNEEKANETLTICRELGVEAIVYKADVTKDKEVVDMIKATVDKFGRIDILVNNAGITRDNLLMRMSEKDFDDVIDTNLKGTFLCMKHICRTMMKQRSGKIINMSSVVGVNGNAGQANYSASKAGIIGITKSMAKELASRNINVNAIAPGFIQTDMTNKLTDEQKQEIAKHIPLAKLGDAENIAKVAAFLASDNSNYITGQVINVDGGMSI